jgi:hypothetical protein
MLATIFRKGRRLAPETCARDLQPACSIQTSAVPPMEIRI